MDESAAWTALRPRLQSLGLDPHRVENIAGTGTPDINYLNGWIELKWLATWPRRAASPVIVKTLVERPQQVAWLMRRWAHGAPAYLMLRVDQQWLLFAGCHARLVRQGLAREDLLALAVWKTSAGGVGDWNNLRTWLIWDAQKFSLEDADLLVRLACTEDDDD